MLEQVIQTAKAANIQQPEDYRNPADGLLYCGKCHTPKEYRLPDQLKGFPQICPIMCNCSKESTELSTCEAEAAQQEVEREKRRADAFGRNRCINNRFEHSDTDGKPFKMARNYAHYFADIMPKGYGLIFCGDPESGKTFLAACIANAVIDAGYSSFFVNVTQITAFQTPEELRNLFEHIESCDLLVIDDLGAERSTDYSQERVYSAIDRRYNTGKPFIVTTNLSADAIGAAQNAGTEERRKYSRILERNLTIPVEGRRRRSERHETAAEEILKIIGG